MQSRVDLERGWHGFHHPVGPLDLLPVVHHHLVVLAEIAKGDELVLGCLGHPKQAGALFSRRAPSALKQRFSELSSRKGATVLDDLGDTQRFAEEPGLVVRQ